MSTYQWGVAGQYWPQYHQLPSAPMQILGGPDINYVEFFSNAAALRGTVWYGLPGLQAWDAALAQPNTYKDKFGRALMQNILDNPKMFLIMLYDARKTGYQPGLDYGLPASLKSMVGDNATYLRNAWDWIHGRQNYVGQQDLSNLDVAYTRHAAATAAPGQEGVAAQKAGEQASIAYGGVAANIVKDASAKAESRVKSLEFGKNIFEFVDIFGVSPEGPKGIPPIFDPGNMFTYIKWGAVIIGSLYVLNTISRFTGR